MFFSTELLSRRDSGYGLLWLAATLGSKTKKLSRRSVLTADITQLCGLVSEPTEPLALRLSSNLMVGVVRVYKLKHEIFETDVGNCVTSLKKTLQELHMMNGVTNLEMAQPNGLREDALDLVHDPRVAMANEFDAVLDDWDIIFRHAAAENILDDDEFNPVDGSVKIGDRSPERHIQPSKKKLHLLDESHDHLLSISFSNSFLLEGVNNQLPSSSANDVLFDLDFGEDPDVGLEEEMERDLEEAWNMKINRAEEAVPTSAGAFVFDSVAIDVDHGFEVDAAFVAGSEPDPIVENGSTGLENEDNNVDVNVLYGDLGRGSLHTPLPHDMLFSRSILVETHKDNSVGDQSEIRHEDGMTGGKARGTKKSRKKVTLVDPRIEMTDEELRTQRENYLDNMLRLGKEAKKKKELKDKKRRFEEEILGPPKDFLAPDLIEWVNQRVIYPIKAREAAIRKELEELQRPTKKRRLLAQKEAEKIGQEDPHRQELQLLEKDAQRPRDFDPGMDVDMEIGGFDGDWGGMDAFNDPPLEQGGHPSGGHRSSDDPGQPRRGSSRPPSLPGSSLLGRGAFNFDDIDPVSNSIFPWDNAGPSSSNAPPGSIGVGGVGGSELALSFENATVRVRKGSGGRGDSPALSFGVLQGDLGEADAAYGEEIAFEPSMDEVNFVETQESESMVTLERNSFNFLGYAKMHTASNTKPLFFSDIVPTESSSTRVAAEGFYHCLALATKDFIRLEQNEPYGPIRIQIK